MEWFFLRTRLCFGQIKWRMKLHLFKRSIKIKRFCVTTSEQSKTEITKKLLNSWYWVKNPLRRLCVLVHINVNTKFSFLGGRTALFKCHLFAVAIKHAISFHLASDRQLSDAKMALATITLNEEELNRLKYVTHTHSYTHVYTQHERIQNKYHCEEK